MSLSQIGHWTERFRNGPDTGMPIIARIRRRSDRIAVGGQELPAVDLSARQLICASEGLGGRGDAHHSKIINQLRH